MNLAVLAVALNVAVAVLTALQGLDWVHVLPQGGGTVAMVIATANTLLHLWAGRGPLAKKP